MNDDWSDAQIDDMFADMTSGFDQQDTEPSAFQRSGHIVDIDLSEELRHIFWALFQARADRIRRGDGATVRPTDEETSHDQAVTMAMAIDDARLDALDVDLSVTTVDRATAWKWAQALNDVRMWLLAGLGADVGPHHATGDMPFTRYQAAVLVDIVGAALSELVEALRD